MKFFSVNATDGGLVYGINFGLFDASFSLRWQNATSPCPHQWIPSALCSLSGNRTDVAPASPSLFTVLSTWLSPCSPSRFLERENWCTLSVIVTLAVVELFFFARRVLRKHNPSTLEKISPATAFPTFLKDILIIVYVICIFNIASPHDLHILREALCTMKSHLQALRKSLFAMKLRFQGIVPSSHWAKTLWRRASGATEGALRLENARLGQKYKKCLDAIDLFTHIHQSQGAEVALLMKAVTTARGDVERTQQTANTLESANRAQELKIRRQHKRIAELELELGRTRLVHDLELRNARANMIMVLAQMNFRLGQTERRLQEEIARNQFEAQAAAAVARLVDTPEPDKPQAISRATGSNMQPHRPARTNQQAFASPAVFTSAPNPATLPHPLFLTTIREEGTDPRSKLQRPPTLDPSVKPFGSLNNNHSRSHQASHHASTSAPFIPAPGYF
ncbi:hypothetical protein BOTBODRAFT_57599 [Botryobasidium botryosum FD-172 SS1]|uniref:Uncharacterized protein n=1 Tax=Botryobasidium botryosum (strain FD-172 SS1) TaxID=930990 RepID=A0A067M5J0_BOTB1|nr:hypothetical protein BOTBODRAFT_57599 [Botryobasidium botryosum FD-172 SS1]